MSWKDVKMPPQIAALPKDPRGLPIFYSIRPPIYTPGQVVDFRVLNVDNSRRAMLEHRCGVCGQPIKDFWFIGGPMCLANRIFGDPPMHLACARYAMEVCPYLSRSTAEYNFKRAPTAAALADPSAVLDRPPYMILLRTPGYQVLNRHPQTKQLLPKPLVRINPWSLCEFRATDGTPTTDRYAVITSALGTGLYCFGCIERGKPAISFNPTDVQEVYCACCHRFLSDVPVMTDG